MSFDDMPGFRLSPFAPSQSARAKTDAVQQNTSQTANTSGANPNDPNASPDPNGPPAQNGKPGGPDKAKPGQGKIPGAKRGGAKMPFGPKGGAMQELSSLNQQLSSLADSMWGDIGSLPPGVSNAVMSSVSSIASGATSLSDAMDRMDRLLDMQSSVSALSAKAGKASAPEIEAELNLKMAEMGVSDSAGGEMPQALGPSAGAKGVAPPAPPVSLRSAGAAGNPSGGMSSGAMLASLPAFGGGKLNFKA